MSFSYSENESGSSGSSSSSSNSNSKSGTLPWYNDYVQNLLGQGKDAMQPWQAYQGNRVAGFVPDQTQSFQDLRNAQGNWQPNMTAANQATGQALSGMQGLQNSPYTQGALNAWQQQQGQATYDQGQVGQFMNPYVNNVVNEVGRLGNENFNNNILKGINDNFTGAGQFGSARQMNMTGQAAAKAQGEISAQQGNLLFGSQNEAMRNYSDWANKGMTASQNQAQGNMGVNNFLQGLNTATGQLGAQHAQLGAMNQQMAATDSTNLFGAGLKQQEQNQRELNAGYDTWNEERNYPWTQLNNWAELFKVPTPNSSTSNSSSSSSSSQKSWGEGWSTSFKKGGLARMSRALPRRMAQGGEFNWQIDPEVQAERDAKRFQILLNELSMNPTDHNLMAEIEAMDGMIPSGARISGDSWAYTPTDLFEVSGRAPDPIASLRPMHQLQPLEVAQASSEEDPFNLRQLIMESQAFSPRPEPSLLRKLGEASMDAASQGPANWGQILGRAGKSYFDADYARDDANRMREAAQLKMLSDLEQAGLRKSAFGSSLGEFKQARGKDGSVWMVSSVDPTKKTLVAQGNYHNEIATLADRAARDAIKDATFPDANSRAREMERLTQHFTQTFSDHFAQGGTPNDLPSGGGGMGAPSDSGGGGYRPSLGGGLSRSNISESGASPYTGQLMTPQEIKEGEAVGKGMGDKFLAIQDSAGAGRDMLKRVDQLENLLGDVYTGKLTPLGKEVSSWAHAFGLDIDENLGNTEAAKAIMAQFALEMRNPAGGAGMPGAMSDKDREFLASMVPNLAMTPDGIQQLLTVYRKVAQRQQDVARLATEYRKSNPRGTFDEGFETYLQDWSSKNPMFYSAGESAPEARPAPSPGTVVDGYRFNGGNIKDRANWEKVN